MDVSTQIEQILAPVRAALAQGESLGKFCKRKKLSYSAIYRLLKGERIPKITTLERLHRVLSRPNPDPRPYLSGRIEQLGSNLHPCVRFGPLTMIRIDRGGGATTLLDTIEIAKDPFGPGWGRIGTRLEWLETTSSEGSLCLSASEIEKGPYRGGIRVVGTGSIGTEIERIIWPSLPPLRSVFRPDLLVPRLDPSEWDRVRKNPTLVRIYNQHRYPHRTFTFPWSDHARWVAWFVFRVERGEGLVLLDRPDLFLSEGDAIELFPLLSQLVGSGLVKQVVWVTDSPSLEKEAKNFGWS